MNPGELERRLRKLVEVPQIRRASVCCRLHGDVRELWRDIMSAMRLRGLYPRQLSVIIRAAMLAHAASTIKRIAEEDAADERRTMSDTLDDLDWRRETVSELDSGGTEDGEETTVSEIYGSPEERDLELEDLGELILEAAMAAPLMSMARVEQIAHGLLAVVAEREVR